MTFLMIMMDTQKEAILECWNSLASGRIVLCRGDPHWTSIRQAQFCIPETGGSRKRRIVAYNAPFQIQEPVFI